MSAAEPEKASKPTGTTFNYATPATTREDAGRHPVLVAGKALSVFVVVVATIAAGGAIVFCLAIISLIVQSLAAQFR